MESLVRKARQSQLPKVEDLERHCQFVQLKSIAHMYNFSPAELEYLPTHKPIGIVRKIMRSGAASSLTDALKVVFYSTSISSFRIGCGIVLRVSEFYCPSIALEFNLLLTKFGVFTFCHLSQVVNMCKVTVVEVYVTYVKFLAKNGKVCGRGCGCGCVPNA